jgi:hypothetical protein
VRTWFICLRIGINVGSGGHNNETSCYISVNNFLISVATIRFLGRILLHDLLA